MSNENIPPQLRPDYQVLRLRNKDRDYFIGEISQIAFIGTTIKITMSTILTLIPTKGDPAWNVLHKRQGYESTFADCTIYSRTKDFIRARSSAGDRIKMSNLNKDIKEFALLKSLAS